METKLSGVPEVTELEERQARLARREAQKQERLQSKFAREAQRAEQKWRDECKRIDMLEEADQQRCDKKDAEIVQRTQEQYKRMSKWQQAMLVASPAVKEAASAEGSQTWQSSMLAASTLEVQEAEHKAELDAAQKWGRQSRVLQYQIGAGHALTWKTSEQAVELFYKLQESSKDAQPMQQFAPIENRKVRILALSGSPGNANVMKFATTHFRKALGNKKVEWLFLDAPHAWEPKANPVRASEEPVSDFEKRIANGQPFMKWFDSLDDGRISMSADASCEHVEEHCRRLAPIDFVVAFSQAGNVVAMLIDKLRQRGEAVPWRLSIFFNGGFVVDPRRIFKKPHPHPTMVITGGEKDVYSELVTVWMSAQFSDMQLLEHTDGHIFPTSQPRAAEIYKEIAAQIWKHAFAEELD